MSSKTVIQNAQLVMGDNLLHGDLLIEDDRIARIATQINVPEGADCINAGGTTLLPGLIDTRVRLRKPGHGGSLESESRAAVLGGITSVFEVPNKTAPTSDPLALTNEFRRSEGGMATNHSFFVRATGTDLDSIKRANELGACGVFVDAMKGAPHVEDEEKLLTLFESSPLLIAMRGEAALAHALARRTGARLHCLHLTTAKELELFEAGPLENKKITAEACVHHLFFDGSDDKRMGEGIEWHPSVNSAEDRDALVRAVNEGRIDVIATDHAPYTREEKTRAQEAVSAGPLAQHALLALLELCSEGALSMQTIVNRMCHAPARLFGVKDRGELKEGYYADLVIVDLDGTTSVTDVEVASRAGWSPFDGKTFGAKITNVWVNGTHAAQGGQLNREIAGRHLELSGRH